LAVAVDKPMAAWKAQQDRGKTGCRNDSPVARWPQVVCL